ncbi:MAG: M50 family metallopeptidase [Kiritimatiellae bacterium]|nr:M50 family metallopeptidase [Kiritimatiellia bacterium]
MIQNFRYRLCELFGIPLYLDFSLIFLLLFFVFSGGGLHEGIVCAALLLFSIAAHELGHALTARAFGYPTRDITLSLLGGCASLVALPRKAWQEFLTAFAGPAVSFILAALGALCISFVAVEGGFLEALGYVISEALESFRINVDLRGDLYFKHEDMVLVHTLFYLSVMNMMLGIFNLLPGFPMDGGRIFRSALTPFTGRVKATYYAMIVGRGFAILLGLAGIWRVMNGLSWGLVTILIAWMIWKEGYREYLMARMESMWGFDDYRAKASPPPYGGRGGESDVGRD